jgi:transposase
MVGPTLTYFGGSCCWVHDLASPKVRQNPICPVVENLRRRGIQPVIPRKRNQKRGRPHNAELYRERNLVERFFGRIRHFRAVATRYDKRASSYLATVLLASIVMVL